MGDRKYIYRNLKRSIKKAGNKKRRTKLKKLLHEHLQEAHWDEYDYGRYSSTWLNGMDKDRTRRSTWADGK
ncbi:MAG TPA: hypothetical protein VNX28_15850 [Gemmataceae bacterium]|jgi:hypothetical protein|nr:hypothetical protein [Gemmataceae bacterium]